MVAAIHSTQLSQVVVAPTEPPKEELQDRNPDQTDWECSDDDFDSCFVRVVIHNLSPRDTIREESDDSDRSANWCGMDTSGLTNSTGLL
jgi:hypothetical protein